MSSIVSVANNRYSKFDPSKITDCNLWLDASNSSSITLNAGNVSQWNDLSGSGNHATQGTAGSQPAKSGSFVVFSSDKHLKLPGTTFNNLANWSIFMVFNPISSTNWILNKANATASLTKNWISMTRYTNPSTYANTLGTTGYMYYTGAPATNASTSKALTTSSVQLVELHFDDDRVRPYINGILSSNDSQINTFASYDDTTITSTLGAWFLAGVIQNSGVTNFQLGELIIFSNAVSFQYRHMISRYLMNKWGIKTDIDVFFRYFSPKDIPNCAFWFDASDLSTMFQDTAKTQRITATGQNVLAIVDKANGNTLTRTTTTYPTITFNSLNGLSGITYNLNPHSSTSVFGVTISGLGLELGKTLFCVFKTTKTTTSTRDLVFECRASDNSTELVSVGVTNSGTTPVLTQRVEGAVGTGTTTISNTNVLCSSKLLVSVANSSVYYNLGAQYTKNTAANSTQRTGLDIPNPANLGNFVGVFYEVIVYNTYLVESDRKLVEAYLSKKWNIALTTSTNSLKYGQLSPRFEIRQYFQLASLWLDSTDPAGTGVLPTDGTSISKWQDKSYILNYGMADDKSLSQATGANQPIFTYDNGYPAIYFSGSPKFLRSVTNSVIFASTDKFCFFIVSRVTSTTGTQMVCRESRNGLVNYFNINQSAGSMTRYYSTLVTTYTSTTYTPSTNVQISVIRDVSSTANANAQNMFYVNGTNVGTTAVFTGSTADTTGDGNLVLGADTTTTNFFTGYIYEVIVFKRYVPDYERQLIEGYLAWKWGAQTYLPSTHPYKNNPPI